MKQFLITIVLVIGCILLNNYILYNKYVNTPEPEVLTTDGPSSEFKLEIDDYVRLKIQKMDKRTMLWYIVNFRILKNKVEKMEKEIEELKYDR